MRACLPAEYRRPVFNRIYSAQNLRPRQEDLDPPKDLVGFLLFFFAPIPSLPALLLQSFSRPWKVKNGPTTQSIFLSAAPMDLSGPTVNDLLRIAEKRLSQNNSSQPAHLPDQSDTEAWQPTVGDGNNPTAAAGLEPRVVSAKATQKVSNMTSSLCCPHIRFCRMMRTQ